MKTLCYSLSSHRFGLVLIGLGLLCSPLAFAQGAVASAASSTAMTDKPASTASLLTNTAASGGLQGKLPLTLPTVLDSVLRGNATLQAKKSRLGAAFEDVAIYERRFYPSASFSAQSRSATQSGLIGELAVRQPLYTFGALTADVEVAKKQTVVNRFELMSQERLTLVDAVDAARQLEEARLSASVLQEADAKYAAFAAMMERRVQGGVSAPVEVELLSARQIQNGVERNRFQGQAKDAAGRLEQLSGGELNREGLLTMVAAESGAAGAGVGFLRQIGTELPERVKGMPAVLASQTVLELETERLKSQKAKLMPRLELQWAKQVARNSAQLSSAQRNGAVTLQFSADTTNGLSGWAGLQGDVTRLTAFAQEAQAKAREAERDLSLTITSIELEAQRQPLLARSVASTQEVLASYERQFAVGRKSWSDVLNAVRELQTSQLDLAKNTVTLKYAIIRLRTQLGLNPLGKDI